VRVVRSRLSYRIEGSQREDRSLRVGLNGLALIAALSAGGCAMSFPITSLVSDPEPTGSIAKPASPLSPELSAEDWRRAKGALAIALDPVGNGSSASWENPDSGMSGSFTPVGQPFVKSDEICRAFLAELNGRAVAGPLQGTACKPTGREWAIRDIRPWKKPA
jgi:hypothetical protein